MSSQNKNRIKVSFDPDWVSEKQKAGIRIVRILESVVRSDDRALICSSSRTGLLFETDASHRAELVDRLAKALVTKTGESDPWAHADFSGDVEGLGLPRNSPVPPSPCEKEKDEPVSSETATTLHRHPATAATPSKCPGDTSERQTDTAAEALERLCEESPLRYEPELSGYLREVAAVVPRLQALGAMGSFWRRNLLVSIDDGWGFSAFRKSLESLYRAHGLVGENAKRGVRELEIRAGEEVSEDRRKALDAVRSVSEAVKKGAAVPLVCLDISAWQEKLGDPASKEFLRQIDAAASGVVCVFRVAFLEPGVLRGVERELDDVLSVKTLAAPPASMDEMVSFVREKLAKTDFVLSQDADVSVERWILREMSDGSFFGYKTLDKIADRIVYDRVLAAPPDASPVVVRTLDEAALRVLPGAPCAEDDPDETLAHLVGMEGVKKTLEEIVAQLSARRELTRRGRRVRAPAVHMAFSGAPGTGKTTMARIAAGLLKKAGLLRKGHLVEVRGRDLCGEYVGQTAPKTSAICRRAAGSVLFVDEAYSLFRGEESSGRDYGREALDTLVAEMENHRDDFCVILAGYPDEMSVMLGGNAGLGSRIPHRIEFPNYTREELGEIFLRMTEDGGLSPERGFEKAARDFFRRLPDATLQSRDFGNARLVRNLYERVWGKAAYRRSLSGEPELRLLVADLDAAAADNEFKSLFSTSGARRPLGFAPA